MTTLRGTIARRLVAAKNETAMLTTINELDMRGDHGPPRPPSGGVHGKKRREAGFHVVLHLGRLPRPRGDAGDQRPISGGDIVYPEYCDIGISVSTPKGLVVPVVRDAHLMDLPRLEAAIQALADRARAGKLTVDEMSGGTFTITNGGGSDAYLHAHHQLSPIGHPGMHTIKDRPVPWTARW